MKTLLSLAACAALAWSANLASAATIVSDNFDGYANQAAFEGTWIPIGAGTPATSLELSTAQSVSAPKSARAPGAAASANRNRLTFADTAALTVGDQLIWSFDFYDVGTTAAGSPQRNYSNLQDTTAPGASNQLIAMGFNNNQTGGNSGGQYYMARILGYTVPNTADPDGGPNESITGAGAFFKLNDFGAGLRSADPAWVNLKVIMSTNDGVATDYSFYVNNVLAEKVDNIGGAGTLRQYDNIALGSGLSNGSVEAFFDNMSLELVPVPEPACGALLAMSALALVAARRRAA
jgi:hypothetical protein